MRFFLQTLLVLLCTGTFVSAQFTPPPATDVAAGDSPYHFSWKRDLSYLTLGGLSAGTGVYLQERHDAPLLSDLRLNSYATVNVFDRLGLVNGREGARKWSDRTLNASAALPAVLFLSPRLRRKAPQVALLYTETMLITGGVTNLLKTSIVRPRPYVYGEEWNPNDPLSSGDRASFISGHTSLSAAGSFFFARVFTDFHPDSKLKPVVWTVAATLPAVTGYLRVRAAKHFPTDVIAGYAFGATVGYLVPTLHKKHILPRGMRINGGTSSVGLTYTW